MKVNPEKKSEKPKPLPEVRVRIKPKAIEKIPISGDYIRLDALLKFAAIVQTGGEAKMLICDGLVGVNGDICTQRGKKLYPGDRVSLNGNEILIEAPPTATG